MAVGTLFLPKGEHPAHSVPAVIFLHGAGGVIPEREPTYAAQLADMGVAALVVDSFAARRDLATNFIDRVLNITETMIVSDVYAGRYLSTLTEIAPYRVALIGFSYGAMATTYALYDQMADQLAPPGLRFAGHVAFYGPCIARFDDNRTTGARLS